MINKDQFEQIKDVYEKVGIHTDKVQENKEKIYSLSRKLSDKEGYMLVSLFDETIEHVCQAFKKVHHK